MHKILLILIFFIWNLFHIWALNLNLVLKNADGFAYLQMAWYFKEFSISGFWNGWFGFLYSIPIAIVDLIVDNLLISSFIVNIILFNIFVYLVYIYGKRFLSPNYNLVFIALIFTSPILLHYNINTLSENIYLPLFLGFFIFVLGYTRDMSYKKSIIIWLFLALLYYTRSEAFIYLWSIWLIIWVLWLSRQITFKKAFAHGVVVIFSFIVFILPYVFYLHSFTGEWGVTNKWSSNLRQANLRDMNNMDDEGFERAVAELTPDRHHLIAGFAGGMPYDKPSIDESLVDFVLNDPRGFIGRFATNQLKLYTNNLPSIVLGDSARLFFEPGSRLFHHNYIFLIVLLLPILLWVFGVYRIINSDHRYIFYTFLAFFGTWAVFFTIFFTLDRYFLIFMPIILGFIVYGASEFRISRFDRYNIVIFTILMMGIYLLWDYSYYNNHKLDDDRFMVKKLAWEYLRDIDPNYRDLKILERWPITTYYSGSLSRYITPYTDELEDILEYARYRDIDYLVVDSLDFYDYRPELRYLLDDSEYEWLESIYDVSYNGERVIIYEIVDIE